MHSFQFHKIDGIKHLRFKDERTIEKNDDEGSKTGSDDAETMIFNRKLAGIEIWNLLQNNKLSAGDFCRRVLLHCFPPPRVTSLFLTDDAIIQLHATYKKMDFPFVPRLVAVPPPSTFFEGSNATRGVCLAPLFRPIKRLINYLAKGVKRRGRVGALSCSNLSKHVLLLLVTPRRNYQEVSRGVSLANVFPPPR